MTDLITYDFLRDYLGEQQLQAAAPAKEHVELMITSVSRLIENYLGRPIFVASRTDYFDIEELQTAIFLPAYPVTTVTTVHNSPDQSWNDSTEIDSDDYSLDTATGRLAFHYRLLDGSQALRAVYSAGLVADQNTLLARSSGVLTSPYGYIANAAAQQTGYMLTRAKTLGAVGSNTGRGRVTYQGPAELLPIVKMQLDPIRTRRMAR